MHNHFQQATTSSVNSSYSSSSSQLNNTKMKTSITLPTSLQQPAATQSSDDFPYWVLTDGPLIRHIWKAAHFVCASHLAGLLRNVVNDSADMTARLGVLVESTLRRFEKTW